MYKKYLTILLLSTSLSISSFVFASIYSNDIDNQYLQLEKKDDSEKLQKLKFILSDPLYNLHLILLISELIYLVLFIFLNNKNWLRYFGLATDKIATQSTFGYSNIIMEFFFTFLIKAFCVFFSFFFIIQCKNEISYLSTKRTSKEEKEELQDISPNLTILIYINAFYILCYFAYYIIKVIKVREIRKK